MTESPGQSADMDLTHFVDVLLRRRWIVVSVLTIVLVTTTLRAFTARPVYQASTLLVIEKERGGGAVYAGGSVVENSNEDYYQTQYRLLKSLSLTQKVYEDLRLQDREEFHNPRGLDKLQNAIGIFPVPRSRLVYVRVNSYDPGLASRIANTLSEAFVNQNLGNQLFISKEVLRALQTQSDASNDARRAYEALPAVVNNPLIQSLKGEYAKLESQAAEMSQRYTPRYPAMVALRSNMAALKGQIETETDRIVQSLKTELSGQLKGNNVRVVDAARVPEKPVSPKKRMAALLGLLGGFAAGLGAAFLVELLDQSVRTQDDVEKKLHLPFLGSVPLTLQKDAPAYDSLLARESSLTSEAMRNLRIMIDFAGVAQSAKTMLITSAVQGEGKTYIAANLAVVFAQLGESVLLIDGDLRRPRVHSTFGLSSERGLADFLASGRNIDEVGTLLQDANVPNLKILSCGARPPNPSELLNTPRLGALIAWTREHFDRIIIDCTPMFPVNDTILWGRHVKASVCIVRHGKTRVPLILKACEKLQTSGMKILGITVNAARLGGIAYAHGRYYQQYYHSYQHEAVTETT